MAQYYIPDSYDLMGPYDMAQYHIPDSDDLMECPYDKVHMVRAKRFQYHLMKCRNNYTGKEFMTCPFNAKHEMPRPEYRHHLMNCPDQAIIDPERRHQVRIEQGDDSTLKGYTDIPTHSNMEVPQTEDWDEEAEGPVRVGVDPSHFSRVRFLNIGGMSTGEKRRMRQDANLPNEEKIKNMMSEMQISKQQQQQSEGEGSLRLPKSSSYAAMANQPQVKPREQPVSAVFAYSTGRGRGMKRNANSAPTLNGSTVNGNTSNQNGYVNGEQNGQREESEVIYQRNRDSSRDSSPASQSEPKPASQKPVGRGRGRGAVPGAGVGRGMGANFVAPPPGFGGLGRASGWGPVDPSFPQFVVPKVGNTPMPSSSNGHNAVNSFSDPWSED